MSQAKKPRIDLRAAARDVRHALADPMKLVRALQLEKGSDKQGNGVLICCPFHGERHPSCSVSKGKDGTVRVKCFSCDTTADAIGLVAHLHNLAPRGDGFRETLAVAAQLGGLLALAEELRGEKVTAKRVEPPEPEPEPERGYPPADEVEALWESAVPVSTCQTASAYLAGRRIAPEAVDRLSLARALRPGADLPSWARRRGKTWHASGHRLLVRVFDHEGAVRSVRAWRITGDDPAKRVPPAGHKAAELVLANRPARGVLLSRSRPRRLIIVEGEPDFLVASTTYADAVIGVLSGAWTAAFAARVPSTTEVMIWTHEDEAGDRYAAKIAETLGERCRVWRAA